jgi:hypothetical protein
MSVKMAFKARPKELRTMTQQNVLAKPTKTASGETRSQQRKPLAPSILSRPQKIATIVLVCAIMFLGPASAGLYYPTLGLLARDFGVSYSEISLTITAFMVSFYINRLVSGWQVC